MPPPPPEKQDSALDLNRLVIYTSEHAHSSVEKTTAALGLGWEACRKIAVDERYAMKPDALREAIASDLRNGFVPIAIVATVGTTGCTAVDPVPAIADIAAEYALWLHIDAAYAGASAMLPEMRRHFEGCERADSFVVNPHKWMFVPMDLTAFYTARPEYLRNALSLVPEYLRSREHSRSVNYMEYAIPLGRRFRALKLWYVLRSLGSERIADTLREHIRIANLLAGWVDASPDFERMAPTDFSLVCLRFRPAGASEERPTPPTSASCRQSTEPVSFSFPTPNYGNGTRYGSPSGICARRKSMSGVFGNSCRNWRTRIRGVRTGAKTGWCIRHARLRSR